ncbi:MAG TPA: alpha/beta hydrolase, partial [bacterium]|nr:alpha/beta hydrolase [bacterium]
MFLRVGLILVALYFFFRWFERSNIWMPRRDFFATPEAAGLVYEDVEFKTADDVRLHGWYLP